MKVYSVDISHPFTLKWIAEEGFGEFTFYVENGKIICDNEYMFRESVKDVLNFLIDNCELRDGEE